MSAVSGGGWTPGPWAVFHDHPDPETAKSLGYIRTADSNRWNDWGFSAIADCFGCDTPEQAANARLIAAAPELYEALERLLRWVEPIAGDNCDKAAEAEEIASVKQAHAALAKAAGADA